MNEQKYEDLKIEIPNAVSANREGMDKFADLSENISDAVIKRLPRYFRYLRELLRQGKMRISSSELSRLMDVTASQIRQDLNCFGEFGQQGYGYNVHYLFAKISEILGVGSGYRAIVIGTGDLGRSLITTGVCEKRGVDVIGAFSFDALHIGEKVGDVSVFSLDSLETFCENNFVDIVALACPRENIGDLVKRLVKIGFLGIWNFSGAEIKLDGGDMAVENVHLGDSLMVLNYKIGRNQYLKNKSEN